MGSNTWRLCAANLSSHFVLERIKKGFLDQWRHIKVSYEPPLYPETGKDERGGGDKKCPRRSMSGRWLANDGEKLFVMGALSRVLRRTLLVVTG